VAVAIAVATRKVAVYRMARAEVAALRWSVGEAHQRLEDDARNRPASQPVTQEVTVEGAHTMRGLPGGGCEDVTGYRYCAEP
jgi:hypothetical protein